ncbi:MAG: trypsin-like peptidase domain-containing protein [Ruminococcus sp.]|nr:trypsin-like peptidase domain-containing protein [Ruminococcus sp.]
MSNYYYNENDSQGYVGYGVPSQPPVQPPQPPQPPQAPPMQSGYNPPPAPPAQPVQPRYTSTPVPPVPPQAPVRNNPPYAQPPQAPQIPQTPQSPAASPYQVPNTPPNPQQQQPYYDSPYTPSHPPKHPMGAGLKALLIIIITLLFASLFAFVAYVSISSNSSKGFVPSTESTAATESVPPTEFGNDDGKVKPTAPTTGKYEESDSKNKTDKNFKGIVLNKKPKKASSGQIGSSYAFSKVEKSVVGIICYVDGQEGSAVSYTTMGTGIIVTADGYIVTNAHLVNYSRSSYKYKVITNTKKEYKAGVVGYDSRSDLAVLKIDAAGLTPAIFGNSSELQVTEDVIVVGNPLSLNYQNSVTKGIVSALDRQVSVLNNVKCIQTDAAINPGNSGGPLCNMYGQVIGVTNSKIALDDYEGMGFAIPSKNVKNVVDDIIRYSYVKNRVRIGIIGEVDFYNDVYDTGIKVEEITKGGPMDGSGIMVGDFITKFEGKKVSNFADIYDLLEKHKAGDKVTVTVYRPGDGKEHEFSVTLEADEN